MKQVKTLSNSFVLVESDSVGNVVSKLGFRKGGLSYLIKNGNVKFYLADDYFYRNLVWSADLPLLVDGVSYGIDGIQEALKGIFVNGKSGGTDITVDQALDSGSTNPIGNQAVTKAVDGLSEQVAENARKILSTNNLLKDYLTKVEGRSLVAGYARVEGDRLSLNDEEITIN